MPLYIPAGYTNCIVTITNSAGGLSSVNTISQGIDVDASVMDQTVADRIGNIFIDNLKTLLDSGWSVGPVKFYSGPEPYEFNQGGTVDPGTATAAVYCPPSIALSVTKRTGVTGKKYRGRFFLPGVPETLVDEGGVVDSTYLANVQTALNTMFAALVGDAAVTNLVLFHSTDTPGSQSPTIMTSYLARTPVANQRPRQRR